MSLPRLGQLLICCFQDFPDPDVHHKLAKTELTAVCCFQDSPDPDVHHKLAKTELTAVCCFQDSPDPDVHGSPRGQADHELAESGRTHVPSGRLLPHPHALPHPQDRAA